MKETVQHYVSRSSSQCTVTRARVVTGGRYDDVSLFVGDSIVGTLCMPAGKGAALCEQLQLIDRALAAPVTLTSIQKQFERACRE